MIIACGKCKTNYNIDVGGLGPGGRTVRCTNCGHKWFQRPVPTAPRPAPRRGMPARRPRPAGGVHAEAAAVYAAGAWPAAGYPEPPPYGAPPGYPPAGYPPPGYAPPGYPQPGYPPPPYPQPQAAPPPPPAPEAQPEFAPPAPPPEPMAEAEPPPEPAAEAPVEPAAEEPAPSQAQLDAFFKETPEPQPVASLADSEGEQTRVRDVSDIPEPEPIPPSLVGGEDSGEAAKRPGGLLRVLALAGIGFVVLVGGLAVGAYVWRATVVDAWPPAAGIYAMLGISAESLGAGLDIRGVQSSRETEGETEVLIVRGMVANVSGKPRKVPTIRVALFDAKDKEIQHVLAPPLKPELAAGDNVGFRARLAEPSPLARRLEVSFTADQPPAPKGGG